MNLATAQLVTPYTGSAGFSSIGSRFTVFSVNTVTGGGGGGNQDTTNQYLQGRFCCPVYISGNRVRACFALVAYNGGTPVVGETATNGCTLRCALENPAGLIVQMTPTLGVRTGVDGMSIAALGGSLVHFEALVPMNAGDVWWVRVYAVK